MLCGKKIAMLPSSAPATAGRAQRGIRVTRPGTRTYRATAEERLVPSGRPYYWIAGADMTPGGEPDGEGSEGDEGPPPASAGPQPPDGEPQGDQELPRIDGIADVDVEPGDLAARWGLERDDLLGADQDCRALRGGRDPTEHAPEQDQAEAQADGADQNPPLGAHDP